MLSSRSLAAVAAAVVLGMVAIDANALGTAAGTSIQNAAQVSYQAGGSTVTTTSNTSTVTVVEILDAVVTIANTAVTSSAGATQQELVFTLTNTGNGTETFELVALSAGVGNDAFDPQLATPAIYFDTDNSGDFSGGDTAYVPGTNDPTLAADVSVRVLVLNSIPNDATDGSRGRSQLTARARTGVGDPGTAFVGSDGAEAVTGLTRAEATLFGEYLVQSFGLTAVKTQTIEDQFGGARALPGARINYQVVVTPSGSGSAVGATFTDLIPNNTTYIAGSLELNSAPLTDSGGNDDAGEYITTPAPQVRVSLGDLTSSAGPQTIEFAVRIN